MRFRFLLVSFIVLLSSLSFGQLSNNTFWRSEADFIEVEKDSMGFNALILKDNRYVNHTKEKREITRHKIVHIYTAEGLDDHNKVVVSISNRGKITELKARSISKDGDLVELDQSNIKKMEDYSENSDLQLFAIEGAQVGGQIEYTYTILTPLFDTGKELLSKDYPTKEAYVNVSAVRDVHVESVAYNGDFESEIDKYKQEYWFEDIKPIAKEKYSTPRANRAFVEYKVTGIGSSKSSICTYNYFVNKQKTNFFAFNATEARKASSILKKCRKSGMEEELDLVKFAFDIFRTEFDIKWDYTEEYSSGLKVLGSKMGNDLGLTKAFCIVLEELHVPYEVHISCSKYDNWLDPEFCSRYTQDDYLIFLKNSEKYISFGSQMLQFNQVPSWLVGNKAVIIESEYENARFVETPSKNPDRNMTSLDIKIGLDIEEGTSKFKIDGFGTGQVAFDYNEKIYYTETAEELREEKESLVGWRYPNSEVTAVSLVNEEAWGVVTKCADEDCKREYEADVVSSSFYEQVGDNLILNVGTLLGPQNELYSEKYRVQNITSTYNKSYQFTISIEVPEGYTYVENQGCDIDNVFKDDGDHKIAGFKSKLSVEGNTITIDVYEYYAQLNIDKKYYEDYRKIINSAADFNKSTILIKKL
ncbi:MAG: hypothetical protein ACI857_003122 [Arenicella sp.]|jgi:hypothetical protein